jgi:hypothetical protein
VIHAFAEYGSSLLAPPLPTSESDVDIMVLLVQLAVIWIVLHELGHVALGHLCRGGSLAAIEEVELDDIDGDVQRESDADAFADEVMRALARAWGHDEGVSAIAGAIVLQTYRALHRRSRALRYPAFPTPRSSVAYAASCIIRRRASGSRLRRLAATRRSAAAWQA